MSVGIRETPADPARCQSCNSGRHLSCTGRKDAKTECVCTRCMGHSAR